MLPFQWHNNFESNYYLYVDNTNISSLGSDWHFTIIFSKMPIRPQNIFQLLKEVSSKIQYFLSLFGFCVPSGNVRRLSVNFFLVDFPFSSNTQSRNLNLYLLPQNNSLYSPILFFTKRAQKPSVYAAFQTQMCIFYSSFCTFLFSTTYYFES